MHSSASQRLWARAPAISNSTGMSPPALSPAPNGADAPAVTASASGKMTSPTTPSASSSLSRRDASHPPRRPFLVVVVPLLGELFVEDAALRELHHAGAIEEALIERVAELGVEPLAVLLVGQPGVAVRRDHEVAVHRAQPPSSLMYVGFSRASIDWARALICSSLRSLGGRIQN